MRFLSWLPQPRRKGSLPTPSPFTRHWLLGQCALLFVLLATFALAAVQVHRYEDGITRSTFILRGSSPVPVLRFTPASTALNIVAVIAHGYSADKELMSAFAVDLAKQGIVVYTFDFPGHGASSVPYGTANGKGVIKQLTTTLSEVVDYAVAHGPAPNTRVVLLGYSLGTIPVSEYALQHPHMTNLAATVLVAGIVGDHPTRSDPHNLLVLTGQFDLPGINDTARSLMAYGCGVAPAAVTDSYPVALYRSLSAGDGPPWTGSYLHRHRCVDACGDDRLAPHDGRCAHRRYAHLRRRPSPLAPARLPLRRLCAPPTAFARFLCLWSDAITRPIPLKTLRLMLHHRLLLRPRRFAGRRSAPVSSRWQALSSSCACTSPPISGRQSRFPSRFLDKWSRRMSPSISCSPDFSS